MPSKLHCPNRDDKDPIIFFQECGCPQRKVPAKRKELTQEEVGSLLSILEYIRGEDFDHHHMDFINAQDKYYREALMERYDAIPCMIEVLYELYEKTECIPLAEQK